jgi:hypothetical protein
MKLSKHMRPSELKIRPLFDDAEDRARLEEWISRDEDHLSKKLTAEFFYQPGTIGMCFEDSWGPVFYVRLDPETGGVIRVHIQFNPGHALRTARTLAMGFGVFHERMRMTSAKTLIFDSVVEQLRTFCVNRFGFHAVPGGNDLSLELK